MEENKNVAVVTFPIGDSGKMPLSNLVEILQSIFDKVFLIAGNAGSNLFTDNDKVFASNVEHSYSKNSNRILRYIITQIKISNKLIKLSKNTGLFIFFMGGEKLAIPIVLAKLLRKKIVLVPPDFTPMFSKKISSYILEVITRFNCILSSEIILYSSNLAKEWNLEKYGNKIYIAHEHFLNFERFKIKKEIDQRENLVGYVGRLSEEKGILNFVGSILEILKKKKDLEFLIGGDGQLKDKIMACLDDNLIGSKVKLAGWISHDELPDYLNELKLIVLPSYTEGLPNIMLEAMACGTPVLATSVGAIPDIIKDEETGFLMKNNTSECITENITRVLNSPDLEQIAKNARKLVKREFTYNTAVDNYRMALSNIIRMP